MIVFLAQTVPEGRVFALDQQTFIQIGIQILNGVILAVALGAIFYKPVKKFMDKRTEDINSKIKNSESTMAKANALIAEYESKMKNIDKEYEKVLEEARIKAAEEEKIIIEEAREEADRIKKSSLESASIEHERIKLETRPYIIELATIMAEKFITEKIDSEEQDKLFGEVLAELEESQWRK